MALNQLMCRIDSSAIRERRLVSRTSHPLPFLLFCSQCDLASLASVLKFADAFKATGAPLDVLCLNAGLQFSGSNGPVRRTSDGFEVRVRLLEGQA